MTRSPLRGTVAIVGAADQVSPSGCLETDGRSAEIAAIKAALDDAGLKISDVDGILRTGEGMPTVDLAEYLGIRIRYTDSTQTGGSAPEVHVEHATAAIASGLCDVAVISYAETPRYRTDQVQTPGRMSNIRQSPAGEWDLPYGMGSPAASYALAARRHMATYGTTPEQLAGVAVSTRAWASLNPRARNREPLTVDDVLESKMIADPLHRLDCCLITDGAGAIVLTTADRARDLRRPPVFVLGATTAHEHGISISQMPDLTRSPAALSGAAAFRMAEVRPSDVDVLETYDSFTITTLLAIEDLGFCKKGEGGPMAASGALGPGGDLPTNTNGGGLSYTHPGMYGIFALVEACVQLRGDAGDRQVPGATLAVANGCGGVLSCTATVVLGTDAAL